MASKKLDSPLLPYWHCPSRDATYQKSVTLKVKILEFESSLKTDNNIAKLSSPSIKFPTPATSPLVLNNEDAALVVAPKAESSSDAVAKDSKSGLVVEGKRVIAIGVLLVEFPE